MRQLGEVIELFDNKRVPLNSRERGARQGVYPYYGAQGIIDYIDGYLFDGRYILVAEDGENLNSKKLPLALFAEGKFWVNNHAHILRANPDVADDTFLLACLNHADIKPYVTGAAQPKLSQANLRLIEIPVPPLPVQHRIASILFAYDDLIENNTRRIQILEQMAQAIYREWFVNFRFPGHVKVRMVGSPMGKIPQGWNVVPVPEAVFINPKTTVPREGVKPFVPMTSLASGSMLITDVESREGNNGSKFRNGDTLFARITPCLENGKTAFIQFLLSDDDVAFGSTEFIVMRSRSVTPEYVYLLARSQGFRDNAIKSMTGATGRQRVQEACFNKFLIAHPDQPRLELFTEIIRPMFGLIYCLATKNANLRRTRDLLLPKLISGALDVSKLDIETGALAE